MNELKQKKLSAVVDSAAAERKHDLFLNKENYNESVKNTLITLEVHELFDNDLIDIVVTDTDDLEGVDFFKTKNGLRVLAIDPRCRYAEFREMYEKLMK